MSLLSKLASAVAPARPAVSTVQPVAPIVNRGRRIFPNDRCPCGSGKKYKKCCEYRSAGVPAVPARDSQPVTLDSASTSRVPQQSNPPTSNVSPATPSLPGKGAGGLGAVDTRVAQPAGLGERSEQEAPTSRPSPHPGLSKVEGPSPTATPNVSLATPSLPGKGAGGLGAVPPTPPSSPPPIHPDPAPPPAPSEPRTLPYDAPCRTVRLAEAILRRKLLPVWRRACLSRVSAPAPALQSPPTETAADFIPDVPTLEKVLRNFWDPSHGIAWDLQMPESTLNRVCRSSSGASAREIWDRLRAQYFPDVLRQEIHKLLDGQRLRPKADDSEALREAILTLLRGQRRRRGWTRQGLAWRLGFKNLARLNFGVFGATGRTVQELEVEILDQVAATWRYDKVTGILTNKDSKSDVQKPQPEPAAQVDGASAPPCNILSEQKNRVPSSESKVPSQGNEGKTEGGMAPQIPSEAAGGGE